MTETPEPERGRRLATLARRAVIVTAFLAVIALTGCAYPAGFYVPPTPEATVEPLVLSSPDFDTDGYAPDSARGNLGPDCGDGDNVSPNFEWTGVPDGTKSFVLFMTDPSAPSYVHWVVTGIPGDASALPGAVDGAVEIGVVGQNSRGPADYVGLCTADTGYRYTLYALDIELDGDSSTTRKDVIALMNDHVLAKAALVAKRH